MRSTLFLLLTSIFFSLPAHALHIKEHQFVTSAALYEISQCFPLTFNQDRRNWVVEGTVNEDMNFLRKWITYSHFFHPEKKLNMRRKDSMDRLEELESEINGLAYYRDWNMKKMYKSLGFAVHHLQDAAVPSHIVPVMHALSDGLEAYDLDLKQVPLKKLSKEDCAEISSHRAQKPSLLLRDYAIQTLEILKSPLSELERHAELTWGIFWKEVQGPDFGNYGAYGNSFGQVTLYGNTRTIVVSPKIYEQFKMNRMRQAIDASFDALRWFAQEAGPRKNRPK